MLHVNNKLIPIGYWRETENGKLDLPWPKKGNLPIETREMIAKYLDSGKEYAAWMGYSTCRICGKMNGSVCMTDGEFRYPEGYSHYILDHNIQPDERLLKKVVYKSFLENEGKFGCVLLGPELKVYDKKFMTNSYIDPKTVSIKEHVVNNQKVRFSFFRDNQFWYKTDLGFTFPIPLEEVQSGKVTLLNEDKALLFMRWMRKYVESCKE